MCLIITTRWVTSCPQSQQWLNKVKTEKQRESRGSLRQLSWHQSFEGNLFTFKYMPDSLLSKQSIIICHLATRNINVTMTVSQELLKFTEFTSTSDGLPEWQFKINGSADNYKNNTEFPGAETLTATMPASLVLGRGSIPGHIVSPMHETKVKLSVSTWTGTGVKNFSSKRR